MAVAASHMSASDYLATPESRPERTELVNGTVIVNEPKLPHAHAQGTLYARIRWWVDEQPGRGHVGLPTDVLIDAANVFAPDLWWVGPDRVPTEGQLDLVGLPDLVVEIRSPSTWARDLAVKLPMYETASVAEAWFVDTVARSVLVFRRSHEGSPNFDVSVELAADDVLASPMLPGFSLAVGTVFGS